MNKLLYTFLCLAVISFYSCETDIDVNAEPTDITVIIAAISPQDSLHYLKINKAFLGDENALDLAANADNFTYTDQEIVVSVEEFDQNGNSVKEHPITRVDEIPKDPGIFDNSTNILYRFEEANINRNNIFKLKVVNSTSGKEVTAETKIVGNTFMSTPNISSRAKFWVGSPSAGAAAPLAIRIAAGTDVGSVKPTFIFNYVEHYTNDTNTVQKSIRIPLVAKQTNTTALEWTLEGEAFINAVKSGTPPFASIDFLSFRDIVNYSMEISVAGTELNTFMLVSEPSNTVNQDKPNFTNIENGLGIFSSREKVILVSTQSNVNIDAGTIAFLKTLGLGYCSDPTSLPSTSCPQ